MKTHAIIPIFISHLGCNNDCVFCNQKIITARQTAEEITNIESIIQNHLATLENRNIQTIEVAFYGGSFTGIELERQIEYLTIAKKYKDMKKIDKIHLSTRPDYIDEPRLKILKGYDVDVVELGVQSFDEDVLLASNRGHSKTDIYRAIRLLKEYNFEFGIQLMIGLPKDNYEKSIKSAKITALLKPSLARLYPTMVFEDTKLYEMYKNGSYVPLSEQDAIKTCKDMYNILFDANINIMRVGLKSTDLVNQEDTIGSYHPAFRQLVESEIAKDSILNQIKHLDLSKLNQLILKANRKSFSNLIGHKGSNKNFFESFISKEKLSYAQDDTIPFGLYEIFVE